MFKQCCLLWEAFGKEDDQILSGNPHCELETAIAGSGLLSEPQEPHQVDLFQVFLPCSGHLAPIHPDLLTKGLHDLTATLRNLTLQAAVSHPDSWMETSGLAVFHFFQAWASRHQCYL